MLCQMNSHQDGPCHLFERNMSLHLNKKSMLGIRKSERATRLNRKSVRFWANNRASVARQGLKSISCPKLTDPSLLIQVGHFDPDPNCQICSKTSINDLTKITGEKQTQRAALLSTGYMGRYLLKQLPDWILHSLWLHKVFEFHKVHTAVYFSQEQPTETGRDHQVLAKVNYKSNALQYYVIP